MPFKIFKSCKPIHFPKQCGKKENEILMLWQEKVVNQ